MNLLDSSTPMSFGNPLDELSEGAWSLRMASCLTPKLSEFKKESHKFSVRKVITLNSHLIKRRVSFLSNEDSMWNKCLNIYIDTYIRKE